MVRSESSDLISVSRFNIPEEGRELLPLWSYLWLVLVIWKYVASMPRGDGTKSRVALLLYV